MEVQVKGQHLVLAFLLVESQGKAGHHMARGRKHSYVSFFLESHQDSIMGVPSSWSYLILIMSLRPCLSTVIQLTFHSLSLSQWGLNFLGDKLKPYPNHSRQRVRSWDNLRQGHSVIHRDSKSSTCSKTPPSPVVPGYLLSQCYSRVDG
jgi:hypothetical protein